MRTRNPHQSISPCFRCCTPNQKWLQSRLENGTAVESKVTAFRNTSGELNGERASKPQPAPRTVIPTTSHFKLSQMPEELLLVDGILIELE